MSDAPFYPATYLPPLKTAVEVIWNGRQFIALRLMHPVRKQPRWATFRDGEVVWLPPKRESKYWGEHPECWRPKDPDKWPWDLPEPIKLRSRPSMDKPATTPADVSKDPAATKSPTWWLDHSQITYAEPVEPISLREAEGRVMRAVSMCAPAEGRTLKERTAGTLLAEFATAAAQALEDGQAPTSDYQAHFEPVPADHDDFLTAMGWFAKLNPPDLWHNRRGAWSLNQRQKVMVWRARARPYSWLEIAEQINRSERRVRQLYDDAIEKCWRAANGLKIWHDFTPKDVMAELRAGNAAARGRT